MRTVRAALLVNLAFALGLAAGYPWYVEMRSSPAPAAVLPACPPSQCRDHAWTVEGIVRHADFTANLLLVTHDDIPGVMPATTMGFRASDPGLLRDLRSGDLVQLRLEEREGGEVEVVAVRKEGER
jgi:Cu(I)/Ag(I) efflux system membrane fusion protein